MDFGHLLQREWIVAPKTDFKSLTQYRLPKETLNRINANDIVSGFVHHGCVLLSCYHGGWHKALSHRRRSQWHPVKDWFCRHVLALCVVLWSAANGRVWQSDENPYHLYFAIVRSSKSVEVEAKDFDPARTTLDHLAKAIKSADALSLDRFVVLASYAILWRVDSVLTRVSGFRGSDEGNRLLYPRDGQNKLAVSLARLWRLFPHDLTNLQFTPCGGWETRSGHRLYLFTHYSAYALLRFWERSHHSALGRVVMAYVRHHGVKGDPLEAYVRGCFDGNVHPFDSLRQAMHMLMMATGSPPDALSRVLLRGSLESKQIERAPGPCSVSDVRRVLLSGLCDHLELSRLLNNPTVRYGLYAYARDAYDNQVNVMSGMRWRSKSVNDELWDRIDTVMQRRMELGISSARIDDVCVCVLSK
jgi:hypothetical protein